MKKHFLKLFSLVNICLILLCKLNASNLIETIAGTNSTSGFSGEGAAATSATLRSPAGVCFDTASAPNLYIADTSNNIIRMVCNTTGTYFGSSYTQGNIYTIAGSGPYGSTGSYAGGDVIATSSSAKLRAPAGICVDSLGNLYMADVSNNRIRMVYNSGTIFGSSAYTQGYIYTIVGYNPNTGSAATASYGGDGSSSTFSSVFLNQPRGICLDSAGNLYIADRSNTVVRMVCNTAGTYFGSFRTQGCIYTIAGTFNTFSPFSSALNAPYGVCTDSSGNLYITNQGSSSVRMVSTNGTMSNLTGDGIAGNTRR
jgi:sugar lactone lactonase YvrE